MRSSRFPLAVLATVMTGLAQGGHMAPPNPNSSGFGGLYLDIRLDPATGDSLHLGVCVDGNTGHVFVSGYGNSVAVPPQHLLYEFTGRGSYLGAVPQPAVQNGSALGMRDLEFDGQSILGGSEVGVSVVSPSGQLVNQILSANGPRPIVQPIAGPALAQLGTIRGLALDKNGNGGNGSLFAVNFAGPIVEFDFAGNVLASHANAGWSGYGLCIDPTTGNLWVNSAPDAGDVAEIDRATWQLTGRVIHNVVPGAQGGLSLASSTAGHHEPWGTVVSFAHLVQADSDHVAISRVHLWPGLPGWNEPYQVVGRNGGTPGRGPSPFAENDTLDFGVVDPTGRRTGTPVWTIMDFYLDAEIDAYTDLGPAVPGYGVMIEQRTLNPISVPLTTTWVYFNSLIGTIQHVPLPPALVYQGDQLRVQSFYLEPLAGQVFASTSEGLFIGQAARRGIVVYAQGPNSFNATTTDGFFGVLSDTTHSHGAITQLELSVIGVTGPNANLVFDVAQNGMADRFDGGNAQAAGCHGTYRNSCDLLCGLDYGNPANFAAPCAVAPENSGCRTSAAAG
ncbi:MAG TPA: hypothetical protein VK348_14830, partial [Planctomycetota bacterium]|nr:hypothetical protein [Planctomycetota bacterium]